MRSPADDTPEQPATPAAALPEPAQPEPVAHPSQSATPEPARGRLWARPVLVGALAGLIAAGSLGAAYAIGQATDDDPPRGGIARDLPNLPGMLPRDGDLPGPRADDGPRPGDARRDGGPGRAGGPGGLADRPGDRDMERERLGDRDMERERLRDRDADCPFDGADDASEDADSGTS